MSSLTYPVVIGAYPQYYDYIHFIELKANGTIEMVHGAGQAINTFARGKFQIRDLTPSTSELEITELAEYNPYSRRQKRRDIPDFSVEFREEAGTFPFAKEVVWRVPNKEEWPCVLFRIRYVFDFDPMEFGAENSRGNLYHMTESKDLTKQTHIYYTGGQSLTKKELVDQGVPLELFWKRD